jgi:poly-gamma-glutamate synthesis protein (capsule biosynthesis protein)
MVVGTQAHQPQTYEIYNGKPIFYGLGNLFFDQTYWPGTTRSIILTHYFIDGKYVQTRITPTVYDTSFQTRLMTEEESVAFLTRLQQSLQ